MSRKIQIADAVRFALQDERRGRELSNEKVLYDLGRNLVERLLCMIEPEQEGTLRPGLRDTPARVVKSWMELYAGYAQDPAAILKTQFEQEGYSVDEVVLCKNIEMVSTCEHHMLPFVGLAHVAYIPSEKVVGLSKLARLVDCFARRLQIQEKLTNQIADALEEHLAPKGTAVVIEARHMCMSCRGVKKQASSMVTSALRGSFKEHAETRAEFMSLIR